MRNKPLVMLSLFFTLIPSILRAETVSLASFTTTLSGQEANVQRNITIAAKKLDGVTVQPGAIISFNETVGEGSAANGFLPGRVLYRDETRMEAGGGLCQVSSTLYNALLMSGFSIVERHRHFQTVSYVPAGLDATIRYGKKDLRMKNVNPFPVRIRCAVSDESLRVNVTGAAQLPYRYEMETEEDEVEIPFAEEGSIRPGISIDVYRRKTDNNGRFEKELLYKDFYPPVRNER